MPIPEESSIDNNIHRSNLAHRPLTLINVGRLMPVKGQRQLILAVAELINNFPDIKLYIVGDGQMKNELKQLAVTLKVDRNIEFTGAVDDVAAYLANADIYVSTSCSEGMPVSILEAMAWQMPVIASDIPGNRSVVIQNKTGFLYELDNTEELVNTITTVIQDHDSRDTVAANARKMVACKYSVEASNQEHETLYMSVAK